MTTFSDLVVIGIVLYFYFWVKDLDLFPFSKTVEDAVTAVLMLLVFVYVLNLIVPVSLLFDSGVQPPPSRRIIISDDHAQPV